VVKAAEKEQKAEAKVEAESEAEALELQVARAALLKGARYRAGSGVSAEVAERQEVQKARATVEQFTPMSVAELAQNRELWLEAKAEEAKKKKKKKQKERQLKRQRKEEAEAQLKRQRKEEAEAQKKTKKQRRSPSGTQKPTAEQWQAGGLA
jgi:hypothetical protein